MTEITTAICANECCDEYCEREDDGFCSEMCMNDATPDEYRAPAAERGYELTEPF